MVVFGQKCLYSEKVLDFGQKWLYSDKVIFFGESGCSRAKCCIRAKWLCLGKVVVFWQKV